MRMEVLELIQSEEPVSAQVGKGYHLYVRRNEWVNWDGDTDLVKRSGKRVYLSLPEAEESAERQRNRGTKFIIDELPFLYLASASGYLVLTELFTEFPMSGVIRKRITMSGLSTLGECHRALQGGKWLVGQFEHGQSRIDASDGVFFSRASSPGKGKNHLAWSLTPRSVNEEAIEAIVKQVHQA